MTLVKCKDLENGTYKLFCSLCDAPMDVVDGKCLAWLVARREGPLCMDCDMLNWDLPPVQINVQAGELLLLRGSNPEFVVIHHMGEQGLIDQTVEVPVDPGDTLQDIVYRISQNSYNSVSNGA